MRFGLNLSELKNADACILQIPLTVNATQYNINLIYVRLIHAHAHTTHIPARTCVHMRMRQEKLLATLIIISLYAIIDLV